MGNGNWIVIIIVIIFLGRDKSLHNSNIIQNIIQHIIMC